MLYNSATTCQLANTYTHNADVDEEQNANIMLSDFVFSQYQRGEADLKEWENVRTNTVSAIFFIP